MESNDQQPSDGQKQHKKNWILDIHREKKDKVEKKKKKNNCYQPEQMSGIFKARTERGEKGKAGRPVCLLGDKREPSKVKLKGALCWEI